MTGCGDDLKVFLDLHPAIPCYFFNNNRKNGWKPPPVHKEKKPEDQTATPASNPPYPVQDKSGRGSEKKHILREHAPASGQPENVPTGHLPDSRHTHCHGRPHLPAEPMSARHPIQPAAQGKAEVRERPPDCPAGPAPQHPPRTAASTGSAGPPDLSRTEDW